MKRARCVLMCAGSLLSVTLASGCSIERIATNRMADALAASGSTYAEDDDPELVGQALPFSLKLMESVLAEAPEHRGLLAATSAAFTQYSWAFVQQEGDRLALENTGQAWEHWNRARRLYLRARDFSLRGLDVAHPGFSAALKGDARAAVKMAGRDDVDLLYWCAVSWAAAIALGKDDPALVADLGLVSALIDRALEVDESWDRGAIHAFLITYTMARPDASGDRATHARAHFERAVELTAGRAAGPHVSWAEAVCFEREDRGCFDEAIAAALAVDPDDEPALRLANTVMRKRASWLAAHVDHWILPPLDDAAGSPESSS